VTTNTWLQQLEQGRHIAAVFFDFKQAFDSVTHIPLISQLQQLNLDPNIISWVKNYLSDRTQCVIVNGVASDYLPGVSGVPQRSVLGPLLFLNNLMDLNLSKGSSLVLYADDILLYLPVASAADFDGLQSDVNNIHDCTSCNIMSLNEKKCKLMHIYCKRSPVLPTTPITQHS